MIVHFHTYNQQGPGVAQWLRRCSTSWTVLGSIPGGVTGFFNDIFPSDPSMAPGLTPPPVKMSTRNIPGGKGGRYARLTTSPPSRAECHEIWEHKPPGNLWATLGLLRDSFTFTINRLCEQSLLASTLRILNDIFYAVQNKGLSRKWGHDQFRRPTDRQ